MEPEQELTTALRAAKDRLAAHGHGVRATIAGIRRGFGRSVVVPHLVLLGVGRVREALLEDAYNQAADAGDFDDTRTWVEQTTRSR